MEAQKLSVFFDGGCRVCSWEVQKYLDLDQKLNQPPKLIPVDISRPEFAAKDLGLDPLQVQKYFHVMTADGKVIVGVDAFIEIWRTLGSPVSSIAARLAKMGWVHAALRLGYQIFVQIRPFLPRKKGEPVCDDGTCSIRSTSTQLRSP
ncbi:MAG: DUF393 domain-containing protein [Bdellovibrionales bacterium]|nr:DUF393 domain-containing protein [Bdellovibrionales bacterium]